MAVSRPGGCQEGGVTVRAGAVGPDDCLGSPRHILPVGGVETFEIVRRGVPRHPPPSSTLDQNRRVSLLTTVYLFGLQWKSETSLKRSLSTPPPSLPPSVEKPVLPRPSPPAPALRPRCPSGCPGPLSGPAPRPPFPAGPLPPTAPGAPPPRARAVSAGKLLRGLPRRVVLRLDDALLLGPLDPVARHADCRVQVVAPGVLPLRVRLRLLLRGHPLAPDVQRRLVGAVRRQRRVPRPTARAPRPGPLGPRAHGGRPPGRPDPSGRRPSLPAPPRRGRSPGREPGPAAAPAETPPTRHAGEGAEGARHGPRPEGEDGLACTSGRGPTPLVGPRRDGGRARGSWSGGSEAYVGGPWLAGKISGRLPLGLCRT